jgi:hypothetical protein
MVREIQRCREGQTRVRTASVSGKEIRMNIGNILEKIKDKDRNKMIDHYTEKTIDRDEVIN